MGVGMENPLRVSATNIQLLLVKKQQKMSIVVKIISVAEKTVAVKKWGVMKAETDVIGKTYRFSV